MTGKPLRFPSRLDAAAQTIRAVMQRTRDGLIRVECDPGIDLDALWGVIDPDRTLRFGVLEPFEYKGDRRKGVAKDPRVVTKWRNESISARRESPIIIFGRATGREEAGLRRMRTIVTEGDILETFRVQGLQWLSENVSDTDAPRRFFESLTRMAKEFLVDAEMLADYCKHAFQDPRAAHVQPQKELWRLDLIPDTRAQDPKTPGGRLSLNHATAEFLRSVPDRGADENRLARLRDRATEGNQTAEAALNYARSKDRRYLAQVDLDRILSLMAVKKEAPQSPVDSVDLFGALDLEDGGVAALIEQIGRDVDLSADEASGTYELGTRRVTIEMEAEEPELAIRSSVGQVVASVRKDGTPAGDAREILDGTLREIADTVGSLLRTRRIPELVETYLRARDVVSVVDPWAGHLLEILILKEEVYEAADAYLRAWESMVSAVLGEREVRHTRQLRELLTLLDGEWEITAGGDDPGYVRGRLMPIHPFVLAPLVALVRYAKEMVGSGEVGKQLLWAQDRAKPAYPAIWAPDSSLLIHETGDNRPTFGTAPIGSRPTLSRGAGLEDVVRSYIGLHPYARKSLSLLLIDPPRGGGIASSLCGVARDVEEFRVFVATTGGETADLGGLPFVRQLGLVEDVGRWSTDAGLRAHITCCFRTSANEGVHAGQLQPSRGLHNVLTVSVDQPSLLRGSVDERVPYVCLQPREANQVVRLFLELARSTKNEDKFFEARPLLGPEESHVLTTLSALSDWLVIGTPAPIGLIPPRRFPEGELTYIGRENLGPYTLFVYAKDLFSVRRRVIEEIRKAPIRPATRELEEQLQALAVTVPNGVLRIGRGERSVTPLLGLMAAAYFARPRGDARYFTVTVSVDSLEWTRHWLGDRRCDLLSIDLALDSGVQPQVRLTAVESKSRTGDEELALSRKHPVFAGAMEQVVATLDALEETLTLDAGGGQSVIPDLKLSTLFEHIASEILAQLAPIRAGEEGKLHVLEILSSVSRRETVPGPSFEVRGLVVVTQRDAAVPTQTIEVEAQGARSVWRLGLVRCGILALREMLEDAGLALAAAAVLPELPPNEKPASAEVGEELEQENRILEREAMSGQGEVVGEATRELILQLETACRLRQFPIDPVNVALAQEGPTLVSVPVALRAGASLKPIAAAATDLARELGVRSVVVENDPAKPYHVRFLLPRADRVFPPLPDNPPEAESEHYLPLWLGAEVDGRPFRSHVSEWPHLLIAGTTGSGKTTFIRSLLFQLDRFQEDRGKIIIVDGKGEYDYEGIVGPNRFVSQFREVLLGYEHVLPVLEWLVKEEVVRRRDSLRQYLSSNPRVPRAPRQAYRAALDAGNAFPLEPIVVFVDEFAEIMLAAGSAAREFEDLVQRVVQAGRSALIHLVLATQRPDANVLRGAIKANLPSRVALQLPSHHDSMTVLNSPGAEDLLGSGDLIFQSATIDRIRLQGFMPPL